MRAKNEVGLLRFDRMNENAWCFDMGYQIIYVATGMTVDIQLTNRFQQADILGTPDNGLAVTVRSGLNGKHWQYQLDPNERYPARMALETVDRLIEQAALSHLDDYTDTGEKSEDTSDLPF